MFSNELVVASEEHGFSSCMHGHILFHQLEEIATNKGKLYPDLAILKVGHWGLKTCCWDRSIRGCHAGVKMLEAMKAAGITFDLVSDIPRLDDISLSARVGSLVP